MGVDRYIYIPEKPLPHSVLVLFADFLYLPPDLAIADLYVID